MSKSLSACRGFSPVEQQPGFSRGSLDRVPDPTEIVSEKLTGGTFARREIREWERKPEVASALHTER